ncbi:MAG: hypothetical protein QXE91_08690 [Thermofilaceae archaeon]
MLKCETDGVLSAAQARKGLSGDVVKVLEIVRGLFRVRVCA